MGCGGSKSAEFSSIESASAPSSTPLKTPVKATKSESPISVLTPEQQETKKLKAVLKMQAASRGKFAREKAKNLKEPCVHFLINIRADRDNECMCGWLKSEHKEEAMINARRGSKWELLKNATLINSNELRSRFVQKTKAACEKYEVNMQSINFGECICGLPRGEHSALALLAGGIKKDAGMGQVESAELRGRFVQKMYAPCTKYVVDMGASAVGMCVCGEPRANHSPSALKASVAEKTVVKIDAEQVRKSFVQKEKVGCAKYEVNLEGQTLGEVSRRRWSRARTPRQTHTPHATRHTRRARAPRATGPSNYRLRSDRGSCALSNEFVRPSKRFLSPAFRSASIAGSARRTTQKRRSGRPSPRRPSQRSIRKKCVGASRSARSSHATCLTST
jgi:hypothetical protein